jgi:hypothetical protein
MSSGSRETYNEGVVERSKDVCDGENVNIFSNLRTNFGHFGNGDFLFLSRLEGCSVREYVNPQVCEPESSRVRVYSHHFFPHTRTNPLLPETKTARNHIKHHKHADTINTT